MNQTINLLTGMCAIILCYGAEAQSLKGRITDEQKHPISYATVYLESMQIGTNSNVDGYFELAVKPGKYKVIFRSLGYKLVIKEVEVSNESLPVDVTLPTEVYQINEVVVRPGDEDPAYPIMRKVIAWAPYHLNVVNHYLAEVYLKGTLTIGNIPRLMKGKVSVSSHEVAVGGENHGVQMKTGDV